MNTHGRNAKDLQTVVGRNAGLAPLARAIALALAAGGGFGASANTQAQQAFSPAWFAAKGAIQSVAAATGRTPDGRPVSSLSPAGQQQRANTQLQQSITNLTLAAHGIAAQQAAQAAARAAALGNPSSVPDGLGVGGLDTGSLASSWVNASAPTQSTTADGKTQVDVAQTADKAIANWETFNVGKNTIVQFDQASADWAILNRVTDSMARPSQIQGQIKAPGTVLIVNKNGIVFSGSSQVNTRNLVAAAANIADSQFTNNGIYGLNETPSFTDAGGSLIVEAGAQITTGNPTTVTRGGGYVLLMGQQVSNAGDIETRKGQAELAAGDNFIIRKGVGSDANTASTTRGNEISTQFNLDSTAGQVVNTGLLLAREGDVTLAGRDVQQNGVAVATTTVNTRGTIHLLNSIGDTAGLVALGEGAITAVAIEDDGVTTALDSQRDAMIADSAAQNLLRNNTGAFDNLSRLSDRRDQSRVEIVSGGNVRFMGNSLTLATGGQIAVSAAGRTEVADHASLDVSGAVGVNLSMASNNILVNVQGNELRDSPLNRDSGNLFNNNVWVDRRDLTFVPAGTDGYASDRWYTPGGLLEVSGYLNNQSHGIGEWAAQGGTIALGGNEVVTQAGSQINLSGGTLNVQTGYIKQTWLKGSDGQLYTLDNAPADMTFQGVYKGFESAHPRWGKEASTFFYNPLIAPQLRLQNGYTVGRDAGQLIVSAPNALLQGDVIADVFNGAEQINARPAAGAAAEAIDGYKLGQTQVALPGRLAIANFDPVYGNDMPISSDVVFSNDVPPSGPLQGVWLNADLLSSFGLGGIAVMTTGTLQIDASLTLAPGGAFNLQGGAVDIGADLIAHGGSVLVGSGRNVANTDITLEKDVAIDTRGVWTNALLDDTDLSGLAYINGGSVTLGGGGDVTLAAGSAIDASAGAALLSSGALKGGAGGDIAISSSELDAPGNGSAGKLTLDGAVRSSGFTRGGALSLTTAGVIAIGDPAFVVGATLPAGSAAPAELRLAQSVVLPAGVPLPFTFQLTFTKADPGQPLPTKVTPAYGIFLQADWTVPPDATAFLLIDAHGNYVNGGPGTLFHRGDMFSQNGALPVGYILPVDAFPQGLALVAPVTVDYAAGSIMPYATLLPPGTVIPQSAVLNQDIAIAPMPVMHLATDFFNQGFSKYTLNGEQGIIVGKDARLAPVMPLWRLSDAAALAPTGSDIGSVAQQYLAPVYSEDPAHARLTQRAGVDLDLYSGVADAANQQISGGSITIAAGASIQLDPGHAIRIGSGGQITVDGAISAPGGDIAILNERPLGGRVGGNTADPGALSIWIGAAGVLDVAARAYTALAADGRRYGVAPDGGSIVLGSEGGVDLVTLGLKSTDAAVIVRPGARLDASGTQAVLDLPTGAGFGVPAAEQQTVASNGGSIALSSYNNIFLDGAMRAAAGGPGAAGGSLSLVLETPVYRYPYGETPASVPARLHGGRVITLGQDRQPGELAADLAPGALDPAWHVGTARLSAEQIGDGGFDSLALWGRSGIAFDGDVDLRLGHSITLLQGPLFNTVAGGHATLAAPYVLLDGGTTLYLPPGIGAYQPAELPVYPSGGTLDIEAGQLDLRNTVATNYDRTKLSSRSDLRFLASTDTPLFGLPTDYLNAGADLTLIAQQIYPASGALAMVSAGPATGVNTSTLTIASIDGSLPPLPYSVFGSISFTADKIEQGGVVRAPMGAILLGSGDRPIYVDGQPAGYEPTTSLLTLQPGSVTSVSADGLVIPYGGTVDGVSYTADGKPAVTASLIDGRFSRASDFGLNVLGIALNATNIVGRAGALLDLSGGGSLVGAAFISGRGGSVDTLLHPRNPGGQVYAILPGVVTAPTAGGYATAWNGDVSGAGRQITLPSGVPGLPAGTYTLLPANYALLPGAYRVELGAQSPTSINAMALRDGSWLVSGVGGIANTSFHDARSTQVTVTSGVVLRTYSQYNETGYDAFLQATAATVGTLRSALSIDAKGLDIGLSTAPGSQPTSTPALSFDGTTNFNAEEDGYAGSLLLTAGMVRTAGELVITGPGSSTERTDFYTPVAASAINQIGAPALYIGARPVTYVNSNALTFETDTKSIRLEHGAVLNAAQVLLVAGGAITLESGSRIDTLGREGRVLDVSSGYLYGSPPALSDRPSFVIVSNGLIGLNTPSGVGGSNIVVQDGAALYGEGTIGFYAEQGVSFDGTPQLGARNLTLALPSINIGEKDQLATAQAAGRLPVGINLDQDLVNRLLSGSAEAGIPAVENLILGASQSINLYGAVEINLIDPGTDRPLLQQLVLNTPAIYGYGGAGDTAHLAVDTLVWNGAAMSAPPGSQVPFQSANPGAVIANGPGTGLGSIDIDARKIVFGYQADAQPLTQLTFNRLMLGFSTVNLNASERITANNTGSLSVYAAAGADPSVGFDPATYNGVGGALNMVTPLLTGEAASVMSYYTGALAVFAPAGQAAAATPSTVDASALGAEINLHGTSISAASPIVLPSGKLSMTAVNDITLAAGSQLDLSGRTIGFFDQERYSWGGDLALESEQGNIVQAPGSTIDLSARNSDAGTLKLIATGAGAGAGTVQLGGTLLGSASGGYPGGAIDLRAQRLGADAANLSSDFAAFNNMLGAAGFFNARSFEFKQGNLQVGDEVKARSVSISVDGGSLTVNGKIDASGDRPGTIRLSARDDLTLASGAVLDASGHVLQIDSYGAPVEAQNRGLIELTSSHGWLTLDTGATLNLAAPDNIGRSRVELNAGRTGGAGGLDDTVGDIRIRAAGPLSIGGAGSIAVNGFWTYSPTDADGSIMQDNGGVDPVNNGAVGLNQIDTRTVAFMQAALANGDLQQRVAGLSAYGGAFHLRPGVEIDSSATPGGNLTVKGDLDFSGYRYGPDADRNPASPTYGAGEVGAFLIRAAGNLTVNGNLNDGFAPPPTVLDSFGEILQQNLTLAADQVINESGLALAAFSNLPLTGPVNFDFALYLGVPIAGRPIPFASTVNQADFGALPAGSVITADVHAADGSLRWAAGTVMTGSEFLNSGDRLSAGFVFPAGQNYVFASVVPRGTDLSLFSEMYTAFTVLPVGAVLPTGTTISSLMRQDRQIWAAAPMLAAGSQSWSMRLASGADLAAADTRTLRAASTLGGAGNLDFEDYHTSLDGTQTPLFSVARTGAGSLELLAGGNISQGSLYGIYTAGTQTALAAGNQDFDGMGTYYPDHGGDLLVSAQGSISGAAGAYPVTNWLWRQGSNEDGIKTSWSIDFGSYDTDQFGRTVLHGFIGFGALGGGNVTIEAGRDAGTLVDNSPSGAANTSLVVAVGSTGRVTSVTSSADGAITGGTLVQTGGGDITLRIGGRLNPGSVDQRQPDDANGVLTDLRGDISVQAGAIGSVPLAYGMNELDDPRAIDPYRATVLTGGALGGPVIVPGDGNVVLRARGDLVLGGTGDAGQITQVAAYGGVPSWFSFWQPGTTIDLFSAGGNLTPNNTAANGTNDAWTGDSNFSLNMMPARLFATAASGSIYYGSVIAATTIELAPSAQGELELLARDSIYGGANVINGSATWAAQIAMSGAVADVDSIPNPFKPAHTSNISQQDFGQGFFVFQPDMLTSNLHANDPNPILLYAVNGDLVNVVLGEELDVQVGNGSVPGYSVAKAAHVLAGRDIIGFGNGYYPYNGGERVPAVIMNANENDVSIVSAGRDMFFSNILMAGPGTLEVSAGRNFYQGDGNSITSVGPVIPGDTRQGASIVVQAGVGAGGPDYAAIEARYLDSSNLATPGLALAGQPGKVAKIYDSELAGWLQERYGFEAAGDADALAYFDVLAPEQQRIFLRQVYYAELREGGREYNNPDSSRFGSYLRGRDMIATLFPDRDANGNAIVRSGDMTLFGSSGISSLFGGNIQMLAPGGQIVIGVQGEVPPPSSGVVTQGQGDIQIFSEKSLLLGLSRIMTTFGGDIFAWSAHGDINAGRGAKTTVLFTPPKRVYDDFGNVTLAPQVPSAGAGIATLNPISEVAPGDVDLIAPLGTIDAGEAGIRVSGNVNLAALQVVNAANIAVQGKSSGLPLIASVNVGALANAGAAASQAVIAAQDMVHQQQATTRQALPSIFTVRVLGFGNEPVNGDKAPPASSSSGAMPVVARYDPASPVQFVGLGERFNPRQVGRLSDDEKRRLQQER